jgi:hypothetical protein
MSVASKPPQQAALAQRAGEAADLIGRLIAAGATPAQIAEKTQASERTVYRWWREGHAPHPVLLDSIRKFAAERGV